MKQFYQLIQKESKEEINKNVYILHDQIKNLQKQSHEFINYVIDDDLEIDEQGSLEDQILNAEKIVDRMKEIVERKEEMKKIKEILIKNIESIFDKCQMNDESIEYYHDEMYARLIELEEERHSKKIQTMKQSMKNVKFGSLMKMITREERRQLEEWSGKKCGEIVFDSDKDDWNYGTSVFYDKVINKNNLMIVIEDTDNNKFGGYVKETINKYNNYINDPNSFLFSMKSNGRINGMKKFKINYSQNAFYLCAKNSSGLFGFGGGHDIFVSQKDQGGSYCKQHSFNYEGISNALCESNNYNYYNNQINFTPKHFIVIQMK